MTVNKSGKLIAVAAKIISTIFHPILIPSLGVFIILNAGNSYLTLLSYKSKLIILSVICSGTLIIPLLFLPVYYYMNIVSTNDLRNRFERSFPLFITAIVYFSTFYFLRSTTIPKIIISFILASFVSVMINFFMNLFWKISSHMIGTGGILALIFILIFQYDNGLTGILLFSIIMSGMIASARLYLEAHTPAQIYTGFFLGFACVSLILIFSNRIL